MKQEFDVGVIGGGPGGYAAAIKAAQLGGNVIVFEKKSWGGTCLNIGCIPTKCLLEKANLVDKIRKNTVNGVFKDAGLFSWKKIQEGKEYVVKKLTSGVEGILKSYGITVIKDRAVLKEPETIETGGGKQKYSVKNVIIATGSIPFLPPVKGIKGERVIGSTEALSLSKIPKTIAIIGGGAIGLEFASIFSAFGTEVTVIEMLPGILFNEDREAVNLLQKELDKKSIKIITGAKVEEICDRNGSKIVKYSRANETGECSAEYVMVASGRRPNFEGVDNETLGLELDEKGYIKVDRRQRTSVQNVYAAGDVTGGYQLAHSAYAEAEAAAENCMGKSLEVNLDIMPRCVYSIPQFAAAGITEEQAREKGIGYIKGIFPYAANGKALASDEASGMTKTLVDRKSMKIIGISVVGGYATEVISSAFTAMNLGAAIDDFWSMIFPHPTLSEMVKESVMASGKMAIHLQKI